MKCPCTRDCDRRTITCHGFCQDYKDWREWRDEINRKRNMEVKHMDLTRELKVRWWKKLKQGK